MTGPPDLPYPARAAHLQSRPSSGGERNCEPFGALLALSSQSHSYAAPGEIGLWNTGSDFIGLS